MKIEMDEVKFVFNKEELRYLGEIVLFALDLQAERTSRKEPCMTDDEERFAASLNRILNCYTR